MDPRFSPSCYGPRASRLGHNTTGKNSVHNLRYGPRARLIRYMYTTLTYVAVSFVGWLHESKPRHITIEEVHATGRKYGFHRDFSSRSESTEMWHADFSYATNVP